MIEKRLEILQETLPGITRVAVIGDSDADSSIAAFNLTRELAPTLGSRIIEVAVDSHEAALEAVRKLTLTETDALFIIPSLPTAGVVQEIATAARSARLPFAVYQVEQVQEHGALLSYGSSYFWQGKQAALLVDKVLRGVPIMADFLMCLRVNGAP